MTLADDGDAPCRGTIAPQENPCNRISGDAGIDVIAGFKSDVERRESIG